MLQDFIDLLRKMCSIFLESFFVTCTRNATSHGIYGMDFFVDASLDLIERSNLKYGVLGRY